MIQLRSVDSVKKKSSLLLALVVIILLSRGEASDASFAWPSEITLKAGFIGGKYFGAFQTKLLDRLKLFALEDNVTFNLELRDIQELYTSNLPLIGPECHDGETVDINNITYNCSDFDFIVGDYWPNPE
jgi:hypothetical protein